MSDEVKKGRGRPRHEATIEQVLEGMVDATVPVAEEVLLPKLEGVGIYPSSSGLLVAVTLPKIPAQYSWAVAECCPQLQKAVDDLFSSPALEEDLPSAIRMFGQGSKCPIQTGYGTTAVVLQINVSFPVAESTTHSTNRATLADELLVYLELRVLEIEAIRAMIFEDMDSAAHAGKFGMHQWFYFTGGKV